MNKIILVLTIGSIIIFPHKFIAQSMTNESVLHQTEFVDSLYSVTMEESRDYWVKLPENYNPENGKKYAVVYLLDGFSLKNTLITVYDNYWGHFLPDMILVGISN